MSADKSTPRTWTPRTLAAQALGRIDEATCAVVPPVHVATTFLRDPDNQYRSGNVYGRPDNETVREAEAVIAALEGGCAASSACSSRC
jgi:cystathionine gamma-synthase